MSVNNIRMLCHGIEVDSVAMIQIDHANDNLELNTIQIKPTPSSTPFTKKDEKQGTFLTAVEKASNDAVTTSPDPPQD